MGVDEAEADEVAGVRGGAGAGAVLVLELQSVTGCRVQEQQTQGKGLLVAVLGAGQMLVAAEAAGREA